MITALCVNVIYSIALKIANRLGSAIFILSGKRTSCCASSTQDVCLDYHNPWEGHKSEFRLPEVPEKNLSKQGREPTTI